jgi:hypothetical protein
MSISVHSLLSNPDDINYYDHNFNLRETSTSTIDPCNIIYQPEHHGETHEKPHGETHETHGNLIGNTASASASTTEVSSFYPPSPPPSTPTSAYGRDFIKRDQKYIVGLVPTLQLLASEALNEIDIEGANSTPT